ncbi:MAG: TlpA family protein disulfide reductase [Nevskiaceae bacterium]|jgi:thiol-disulfide isomerase/thioredoxin|nr:TlpA family protein disulfide reductase [Nevskiaceae bacterium]
MNGEITDMTNAPRRAIAIAIATLMLTLIPGIPALAAVAPNAPAPGFELPDLSGQSINLAQYRGQVVMINFWASWCAPCRQEMPLLEQMHKKYQPLGFTMIGVNVEPDSAKAVDWLKATPVTFPILLDTASQVSKLYGVQGMPNTVIVDRKGNLRWLHRGYKPGDENEYLDQIRALVRE